MAARYWVGGTNTWNSTAGTKWATTSGGAGGASVPGASDDVFFNAASGTVTVTWAAASPTVLSINCTGFTGTLATAGNSKTLAGTGTVWSSPATCTITGAPTLTVSSTGSTAISVTCNHASPSATNAPNFSFTGGTYALTLSGTGFRALTFTGSSCTASGGVSLYQNLTLASGGTYTSVVPTFRASATITSAGRTLGNTTVNGSGITVTLADAMTIGLGSTLFLTEGTINLAGFTLSANRLSSSGSTTRSINFGSGGSIVLTTGVANELVLMPIATNFTWSGTGGITATGSSNSQFAFGNLGGATSSNVLDLTLTSASGQLLEFPNGSSVRSINCASGNPSLQTISGTTNLYGNLTLIAGVGSNYVAFDPVFLASATVTSNGKQLDNVAVNGSGITVTLADAMTLGSASTLTLTQGTFTAANFNVTAGSFSSSNSNTRTLNMGSGTWTLTANSPTVWNTGTTTGLTFAPSTSTISMTNVGTKGFIGGGLTYYNLNQGGAGALTIVGSNTFNNITNSVQPATVTFSSGTTQTVSNFGLSGTAGNLVTISSQSAGSSFTLSKASGTVDAQYLSIRDSNATGGAVWNALYSTNLGNNTGWIFPGGNMFLMFI